MLVDLHDAPSSTHLKALGFMVKPPCFDGVEPRMQRTSCGPRRVPLPLELVPVVRRVEHDTAGQAHGELSNPPAPEVTHWVI